MLKDYLNTVMKRCILKTSPSTAAQLGRYRQAVLRSFKVVMQYDVAANSGLKCWAW
jgi:hypothetical protein